MLCIQTDPLSVGFCVCSRKTWGIENFVSSTLLRNMREKDLRKAIAYHMKKSQSQHDPKQKGLSVDQARINYLEELSDLKSFGGKSFSATMMVGFRLLTVHLYSFFTEIWLIEVSIFCLFNDLSPASHPTAPGQRVDGDVVGGGALRRESGGQPQTEHPVQPHRVHQHHTHRAAA